ncbi:peptidoglycan-binding protein LysM [Uliginosibacterium sp. sgz301328]|uniref:peptidoglycan-binding protein LysM n=1 Tax=Uliginosibacterium sp. sgz301328 TaxID=3243764 RepID=UPI00359D8C34
MGIFSFIKEAGEKLFGSKPATTDAAADNLLAVTSILNYITKMNLRADGLALEADMTQGKVTVAGQAADQATREKIVLCCGNTNGVQEVIDNMTVQQAAQESQWHTVVKGDTLWAIAEKAYGKGKGAEYNRIFEANRPMLAHPDKIYPGQVLRIPPLA